MHVPCYNMQNIKKGKTQHSLRPCVAGRHAMTCRSQCNCENTNRMLAVHSCRQRKAQLSAPPVSRRNHLAACRVLRRGMSRRGVTLQSPGQGAFGERIVTYAAGLWHHTQGQHTTWCAEVWWCVVLLMRCLGIVWGPGYPREHVWGPFFPPIFQRCVPASLPSNSRKCLG